MDFSWRLQTWHRSFDFIGLNYHQHQLKQQQGFGQFCPFSVLYFLILFHFFTSPLSIHRFYLESLLVTFKHPFVCLSFNFLAQRVEAVSTCIACRLFWTRVNMGYIDTLIAFPVSAICFMKNSTQNSYIIVLSSRLSGHPSKFDLVGYQSW